MKRSAKILGPTPEFVRWSLRQPCGLRAAETLDSPDRTERLLRPIRELGLAINESRIVDGIAFDLAGDCDDAASVPRGFIVEEAMAPFGGQEAVQQTCRGCSANVAGSENLAGCYGLLTLEQFLDWSDSAAVTQQLDRTIDAALDVAGCRDQFLRTCPAWYCLWNEKTMQGERLRAVQNVFKAIQSEFPSLPEPWSDVLRALQIAVDRNLTLDVELVPAGFSDGLHWIVHRACPRCGATRITSEPNCPVCQASEKPRPELRRKVLGHRPYCDLRHVIESNRLQRFLKRYEAWNKDHHPADRM